MEFTENGLYHIYNRGNNKQMIFFNPGNYLFFLDKVRRYIRSCCNILSYSLMPNHFHFLIHSDIRTIQTRAIGKQEKNVLSEGVRNLLSSYAQGINKQNKSTGSIFQQNTKSKCLNDGSINYGSLAFHYIHQNAFKAQLVNRIEDWQYSSYRDFAGIRNGTLCNKKLAFELLGLNKENFYRDSYRKIDLEIIKNIF